MRTNRTVGARAQPRRTVRGAAPPHRIGLRLRDGSFAQAWARDDEGLRAALTAAVARAKGAGS